MSAHSSRSQWCVQQTLQWAGAQLAETEEASLAAKLLLAQVLECSLEDLFIHPERTLSDRQIVTYKKLVSRRKKHEPLAYLLGHREFMDMDLIVDKRVLIPRPETELLVEHAIEIATRWTVPRIIDVGTGSGAIAIGLARHLPQAIVLASDRSSLALAVARHNARRHGTEQRITFLQGDLLAPLGTKQVEMIVANLPYITEDEYAVLPPDIRLYEPREALVAGPDGLDAIRTLLNTAPSYLVDNGVLLIEIGATQGKAVVKWASHTLPGARVEILSDYAHHDRIVCIERQP